MRKPPWSALSALALLPCAIACATSHAPPCAAPPPPPSAGSAQAPIAASDPAPYRYQVTAGPAAAELCVEVTLPRGTAHLRALPRFAPFIHDLEIAAAEGPWQSTASNASEWPLPACAASACRARYRVALADAATELRDEDLALHYRGDYFSPISSWLLEPDRPPPDARYRLSVRTPPGISFVTGTFLDEGDAYGGRVVDIHDAPYAVLGPLSSTRIELPGGSIDVAISPGESALSREEITRWIERGARAVADYFGRFPIPHASVLVLLAEGHRVQNGKTSGNGGGSVMLSLGEQATTADLDRDWILVHELCHVVFPDVGARWAEEGLSTYLEPIVRVRAGQLSQDEVWADLVRGLPQGLPEPGDEGLDHTDTWGRRYWGGALFWLIADTEIRKATSNTRSLDDALRAIAAAGGNISVTWPLDRVLDEGDKAIGVPILKPLRHRMGDAPTTVDLPELWRQLGIKASRHHVTYDDTAPLAAIRRAITAPRP